MLWHVHSVSMQGVNDGGRGDVLTDLLARCACAHSMCEIKMQLLSGPFLVSPESVLGFSPSEMTDAKQEWKTLSFVKVMKSS